MIAGIILVIIGGTCLLLGQDRMIIGGGVAILFCGMYGIIINWGRFTHRSHHNGRRGKR
jgi:hypothetical protein